MTNRGPLWIDPDGTRHYAGGMTYKPVPPEERKRRVRKPDDPRAVRFGGTWYLPLDVLEDEKRKMPETRPDVDFVLHRLTCGCRRCQAPGILRWKRKVRGLSVVGLPFIDPLPVNLFRCEGLPLPAEGSPGR